LRFFGLVAKKTSPQRVPFFVSSRYRDLGEQKIKARISEQVGFNLNYKKINEKQT
jgi:hypothetical protein